MAVRKCSTHPDCWIVDWRPKGRNGPRPQRHMQVAESVATAYWLDMLRLSKGPAPVTANPKVVDVVPDWQDQYRNNHLPATNKDLAFSLVALLKFYGPMYLVELTSLNVHEQYKAQRLATEVKVREAKPRRIVRPTSLTGKRLQREEETPPRPVRFISKRTIQKELSYLQAFLNWCHTNRYLEHPVKIPKFPPKQTRRAEQIQPLYPDEVAGIHAALESAEMKTIFLLMADGGLRRSEAMNLPSEHVDLRAGMLTVKGKGGKVRYVPIVTDRLRDHLKHFQTINKRGPLILNPRTKKPYTVIRKSIITAAKKAGVNKRVYHHLCRHTFCTAGIAAGMSPKAVQEIAGHSSFQTTEEYITVAGSFLQAEAAKMTAYLQPVDATVDEETGKKK